MRADRSNLNYYNEVSFISGRNTVKQKARNEITQELIEFDVEFDWRWSEDDHGACCCYECMDFTDYSKYLITV